MRVYRQHLHPTAPFELTVFDFSTVKMTRLPFAPISILWNCIFLVSICCPAGYHRILVAGFSLRTSQDAVLKKNGKLGPRIGEGSISLPARKNSPVPWWTERRTFLLLHQSATADTPPFQVSSDTGQDSKRTYNVNNDRTDTEGAEDAGDLLDMPWSDMQAWALRDGLPKYTVQVSVVTMPDRKVAIKKYSLWRTMIQEVTELSGYPLPFILQKYTVMLKRNETACETSCEILPFLDQFEFESNGGLSGRIYGLTGLADGTRIQTTPVKNVQMTIPKGFVQTQDGIVIYELGTPAFGASTMMAGTNRMADIAAGRLSTVANMVASSSSLSELPKVDDDLLTLTGWTAVVVAGATLVGALSHHLTVNVFWV